MGITTEKAPRAPGARCEVPSCCKRAALVIVKAVHSLVFFSLAASLAYFFASAVRGRSDRRAAVAGVMVTAEAVIFAGNGWRCPLTGVAEKLGDERGSVSDIYLPGWLASHIAEITTPFFVVGIVLHARNLVRRFAAST